MGSGNWLEFGWTLGTENRNWPEALTKSTYYVTMTTLYFPDPSNVYTRTHINMGKPYYSNFECWAAAADKHSQYECLPNDSYCELAMMTMIWH